MNQITDPLRSAVSAYIAVFENIAVATTERTRRGPQGTLLAILGGPISSLNAVISADPDPSAEEIEALVASETWDVPWSIHVRGVPGPLVTEVAARHGLTSFEREPLMIRPSDQGLPEDPAIDGLRIRAASVEEMDLYARTVAEGFGAPHEVFSLFGQPELAKIDGMTWYLAELNGVPVGTGMAAVTGELTGIFNITTLPEYRRRGYGRAITLEMIRAGFAAGAGTAYLYASDMGLSVYESLGFRTEEYLTVITAP